MIVVDSNVIVYCWIVGERTDIAQRVRLRDPAWQVPLLWRSELHSALAGYLWQGAFNLDDAIAITKAAENALAGCEHLVESGAVLELAERTRLSAYDCEFVALAQSLSVPLVTEDRAILKAFPEMAVTMEGFLHRGAAPSAHEKPPQYRTSGRARRRGR